MPHPIGPHRALFVALGLLAAGCGAAPLEQGDLRPAVVASVLPAPLKPAPVSPADDSRFAEPAGDADEPVAALLQGAWSEEFESRYGCQDQIDIRQTPSGLRLSGADCNDGEPYDFREPTFDGTSLSVRVIVPSTKYVLRYRLELHGQDELQGEVVVDGGGGGGTTTYKVRWVRESEP